jgi:hypothetical protein
MQFRKVQVKKKSSGQRSRSLQLYDASRHVGRRLPLHVRKRKIRILLFVLISIAVITLILLLSWGSRHSRIKVEEVIVTGVRELPQRVVEAFATTILNDGSFKIFSRNNIFLYPRSKIEEEILEEFPRAMAAIVSLSSIKDPSVVVEIKEREPHSLWCRSTSNCFFLDETGFIFAPAEGVIISGGNIYTGGIVGENPIGNSFLPNHFVKISKLIEGVRDLAIHVKTINVLNDADFSIIDNNGMHLKVSFNQSYEEILSNLKAILGSSAIKDKEIDYIDLRFGNRVYYKFK